MPRYREWKYLDLRAALNFWIPGRANAVVLQE
jgi:hypothetical protein